MTRRLSKKAIALRVAGAVSLLFVYSGSAFSLAYWITGWMYGKTGTRLPEYAAQLVNWALGTVIIVLTAAIVGWVTRPRQHAIWNEMTDALRRIAKGDFNVILDQGRKYDGQIGDFVDTINQMAQELKQVELLRQEFISNVSHEIQSPLTSIRGFAVALQNGELSAEERKHYLSIIETESRRLSKLSDNLLKLTSLESEHQPFEPRAYRLDNQLRSLILACEPQWLEKKLDLELELPETTVLADEDLMSRVWMNVIHNAIKFTPAGGSLKVVLTKTEDHVTVEITDTGTGISPEDQLRIFERFYKGDKSRTRTAGGSGLGLSIVKRIVELHQGSILVESRLSVGSTFRVILPVSPPADKARWKDSVTALRNGR